MVLPTGKMERRVTLQVCGVYVGAVLGQKSAAQKVPDSRCLHSRHTATQHSSTTHAKPNQVKRPATQLFLSLVRVISSFQECLQHG